MLSFRGARTRSCAAAARVPLRPARSVPFPFRPSKELHHESAMVGWFDGSRGRFLCLRAERLFFDQLHDTQVYAPFCPQQKQNRKSQEALCLPTFACRLVTDFCVNKGRGAPSRLAGAARPRQREDAVWRIPQGSTDRRREAPA